MVTKYEFQCPVCHKLFIIKGHLYNQWVLHHWLDCKYMLHCMRKHDCFCIQYVIRFVKACLMWFILVPLQLLTIVLEPFRRLF